MNRCTQLDEILLAHVSWQPLETRVVFVGGGRVLVTGTPDPPLEFSFVSHFQSLRARYRCYRGTPTERPFTPFLRWTIQNSWTLMSNFCIIKNNKLQKKIKCQNKCDLGNNVSGGWWKCKPPWLDRWTFQHVIQHVGYEYEKKFRK